MSPASLRLGSAETKRFHDEQAVATRDALWPALETGYVDEFGPVDPEVHRVAADLWPRAERVATELLADSGLGYRLLKRSVAIVSALPPDRRAQIREPAAYLFQTYKRLVLAELEKLNGHRRHDAAAADILRPPAVDAAETERRILVAQLLRRMDPWSREIFENLALGYSFDEIGRVLGRNPHVVRNRFRLALQRLASSVGQNKASSTVEPAPLRQSLAAPIRRLRMMRARLVNPSNQQKKSTDSPS